MYDLIREWAIRNSININVGQGRELAKLVEEKFISGNSAMVPCQHKFFSSTKFGFVECRYCGETYPIEVQHQ